MRHALRAQIEANRDNIRQSLQGFRALATTGSSCGCWTDICADNFDTGSYGEPDPLVTEYDDPGPSISERSRETRGNRPEAEEEYCCNCGPPEPGMTRAACGQR